MRSWAKTYFRYSETSSLAVAPLDHHGSALPVGDDRKRHERDVRQLVRDLGQRARHVVVRRHHDQRTEAAASAQRRVSIALPSVLSARSKSTQQRTIAANSGLRREISRDVVARLAAADEQALAAPGRQQLDRVATREAPPVSATMPSALRSSRTSSVGTRPTNQRIRCRPQARGQAEGERPADETAQRTAARTPGAAGARRSAGRFIGPSSKQSASASNIPRIPAARWQVSSSNG